MVEVYAPMPKKAACPSESLVGEAADDIPRLCHGGEQQREGKNADPVAARIKRQRQQ